MRTWMFDLDDTLLDTAVDYNRVKAEFLRFLYMRHERAPSLLSVAERVEKRNVELVKQHGFRSCRFPLALQQVYGELCDEMGVPKTHSEPVYGLGLSTYDVKTWKARGLVPGSTSTLDFLHEKGDELLILTKGDEDVQTEKVRALNLERWFGDECGFVPDITTPVPDARVLIVPHKHVPMYQHVLNDREPANVRMVGNSLHSDVMPAVSAGFRVVYIPAASWVYEDGGKAVEHERITKLENIGQIVEKYEEL
ncbi:MAG: HAD family hydrolase [Candidatus Woesearchaeota archaeon]|nr:HAD family hydrolase [Candidatus Woesearchaeota archaeon]MDP7197999.1 HAD family hydrolase [Candidatus Woesearchaeota archaeon]MDP7466833.1 HAD family hydrolase [Candidatus Woesearchaeota archaeon]MDP7648059.1 HAD family hydrolase [Candidatus Woesearchaeota archaeon]